MDITIRNSLINYGFSTDEINAYEYIFMNGGKFTPSALQSYGYDYNSSKRLAYMHKILQGGVNINTENDMISHVKRMTGSSRQDAKVAVYSENLRNGYGYANYSKEELIKHLKETSGRTRKISIQDLKISNVNTVPRVAVVAGINQEPFTIWNSNNYQGKDAMYRVIDVSGRRITVETNRKPQLKYKASKEIPGILEIKGVKQNGMAVVSFDKSVCRLCNRYIIIASLKRPEFHLGLYEIICFEGTKIYVYAVNMGTKDKVSYRGGTQRVYAYGIFPKDIKTKLTDVAKVMYSNLNGVKVEYIDSNSDYKVISSDESDKLTEDNDIDF